MKTYRFLTTIVVGALVLSGCGVGGDSGSGGSGEKALTWASTGGQFQEDEKTALQVPFTTKTGTKFTNISPAEQAQVRTMVASGKTIWDLANMSWIYAGAYCGELFEKLDNPALDRSKFPKGTTGDCFVPTYRYANIFSYNADMFPGEKPTKINDFFDVKRFPGKRIVYDYPKRPVRGRAGRRRSAAGAGLPDRPRPGLQEDRHDQGLAGLRAQLRRDPAGDGRQAGQHGAHRDGPHDRLGAERREPGAGLGLQHHRHRRPGHPEGRAAQGTRPGDARVRHRARAVHGVCQADRHRARPARRRPQLASATPTQQKKFNAFLPDRGRTLEQDKQWWIDNTDALVKRWTAWKVS